MQSFVVLAIVLAGCERIESRIIERFAARGLAGDRSELLEDGKLHIVLCGTGSPLADAQRAGPCTAVLTYHTTPVEAAEVAKAAQARMLAFTHVVPPLPNFLARRMFWRGVSDAWDGTVVLGADGMHFTLAPGRTDIEVGTLG
jgi:hypothetical protein